MKKLILSLFIALSSLSINAQYLQIDNLTISTSPTNSDILKVKLVVKNTVSFFSVGSNYLVVNDTINLDVCFSTWITTEATSWETENLELYLPQETKYTLVVNVFYSQSTTSCDYFEKTDSASLSFNFPFADTGYLALNANPVIPNINLYPNPVQNTLNINSNGLNVDELEIFNVFGKLVLDKAKPVEQIDLTELENGIYFVVLRTGQGIIKEKLIISK
jgi:hypothetical protein